MPGEQLVWELLAVDKASDVVKRVSRAFGEADTKLQKAGKVSGLALAAGGGAALLFGKQAVDAASDLSETTSKVGVLFGNQASAIDAWAQHADTALGQSQQSALDAAATFATFGKAAGLQGKDLVGFSENLTGLASDMASFSNTSPEQAIDAIGAALRGESEPIRAYGVLLDEGALKAQAMSMGLVRASKDADKIKAAHLAATVAQKRYNEALKEHGPKSREAQSAQAGLIRAQSALKKATDGSIPPLTNQQKVLAAQGAIMQQTKAAQGDFARTSTGAANKQRILSAEISNLTANLGKALLPAFSAVLNIITAVVGIVAQHTTAAKVLAGVLAGVAAVIWLVNAAQTAWNVGSKIASAATKTWAAVQWVLNAALTANPIGLIVVGIAALIAGLVLAWKHSDTFRQVVTTAMHAVGAAFTWLWNGAKAVFGWVKDHWVLIATLIAGPIVLAARWVIQHWDAIRSGISEKFTAVVGFVKGIPGKITSALGSLGSTLLNHGRNLIEGMRRGVGAKFDEVAHFLRSVPGRIVSALGDLGSLLKDAGAKLIGGLLEGIKSMIGKLGDVMGSVAGKVKDFFPGSPVKTGPLVSWNGGGAGKRLVGMLADGLEDTQRVSGAARGVAAAIDSQVAGPRIRGVSAAGAPRAVPQVVINVTVRALDPTPQVGRLVVAAIEQHIARGGTVAPRVRGAMSR